MGEHLYSEAERRQHLTSLLSALEEARDAVVATTQLAQFSSAFQTAIEQTASLIANGWTQEELRSLADLVPDPLGMRNPKAYAPPGTLIEGRFKAADWFIPVEPKLEAALDAARRLREIGNY